MAGGLGKLTVLLELNAAQWSAGLQKAERRMQRFGRQVDRLGRTFTARITTPLAVAGGLMVKASADLEQGMIGVQKTTGLADAQINTLRKDILAFSRANNVTISSLSETAKVAGQMGIQGEAAIGKFTKAFAKLEIASDRTVSGELGAQAFSKFLDLSGEGIDAAENMASSLVELGNTSKTTEGKIIETAEEVVKKTARFRLGGANILGLATALDEAGVKAEVSGSTFQRFFETADTAIKSGSGALQGFINVTGRSRAELENLMKTDPTGLFLDFADGLKRLNDRGVDTATILKDMGLGGLRVSSTLQVLAERHEQVRGKIEAANEAARANVALQNEADAANRGFNAALRRLVNTLTFLADAVAQAGIIDFLTEGIQKLTDWVAKMAEANPEMLRMGVAFAAAAAAAGPLMLGLSGLVSVIGALSGPAGLILLTVAAFTTLGALLTDKTNPAVVKAREAHEALQRVLGDPSASKSAIEQSRQVAAARLQEAQASLAAARAELERSAVQDEAGLAGMIGGSEAQRRVSQLTGEINRLEKALQAGSAAAERHANEFSGVMGVMQGTAAAAAAAGEGLGDAAGETGDAGGAARKASVDYSLLNQKINAVANSAREAAIAAKGVDAEQINAARSAQQMEENMRGFNAALAQTDQQLKDQRRVWDNLIDGIQGAWVTMWEDVFSGRALNSIKDFLGTVKDLFLRVIAQIAAAWTASAIFKGLGSLGVSVPSMSFGGGGGGFSLGLGGLKEIGSKVADKVGGFLGLGSEAAGSGAKTFALKSAGGKIVGVPLSATAPGGAAGSLGTSLHGGAAFSGTGAGSSAALGAGAAAATAAAVVAMPFVMKSIFGSQGRVRKQFEGFSGRGALGLQVGGGSGNFGFVGGPMQGFARDFASRQGRLTSDLGGGVAGIEGLADVEKLNQVLEQAERAFESLKKASVQALGAGTTSAAQMGQALKDGVIDRAELARLGLEHFGSKIENARTGMVRLGEVSASQFEAVVNAINRGDLRLGALQGTLALTTNESRMLADMGLIVGENFATAGRLGQQGLAQLRGAGVGALRDIEGAARAAASAVASVGGASFSGLSTGRGNTDNRGIGSPRDIDLTQQLRRDADTRKGSDK